MKSFKKFLKEQRVYKSLCEALITFGGKAYPKFNNVVIIAGGMGSGKSFAKNFALGIEGFDYEIDEMKRLSIMSEKISKKVKDRFGIDIYSKDGKSMNDPDVATLVHQIISKDLNLGGKRLSALYKSILSSPKDRKPNLIFDISMKNLKQLKKYVGPLEEMGYDKNNIHIVWVMNDVETALEQNRKRERTAPDDIILKSHSDVSKSVSELLRDAKTLDSYMNGDFVLFFNKKNVDNELTSSGRGGSYMSRSNYVYLKKSGKLLDKEKIAKSILTKISYYSPERKLWSDKIDT